MKKIIEKEIMRSIKFLAEKEINNTIDGKCMFLCYQPKVPNKLKLVKK